MYQSLRIMKGNFFIPGAYIKTFLGKDFWYFGQKIVQGNYYGIHLWQNLSMMNSIQLSLFWTEGQTEDAHKLSQTALLKYEYRWHFSIESCPIIYSQTAVYNLPKQNLFIRIISYIHWLLSILVLNFHLFIKVRELLHSEKEV